jgi:ASTRA-associated protein 1
MTAAPTPRHILRTHQHPISALAFSADNLRLYSGDVAGLIVVTSTRTVRSIASWNAHTDSILGLEEWSDGEEGAVLITFVRAC